VNLPDVCSRPGGFLIVAHTVLPSTLRTNRRGQAIPYVALHAEFIEGRRFGQPRQDSRQRTSGRPI